MGEQELTHDPIVLDTQPKSKYDDPELITYIVENRNNKRPFTKIAEELKERGWDKITYQKVSEIYNVATAKAITTHNTVQENYDDYSNELNTMNSKAIQILNNWIDRMEKLDGEVENIEDADTLKKIMMIMKFTPYMKMGLETILKFQQEDRERRDKIETTIEKSVMNPSQMIDYIHKHLKILEKSGQIKIIDPALK